VSERPATRPLPELCNGAFEKTDHFGQQTNEWSAGHSCKLCWAIYSDKNCDMFGRLSFLLPTPSFALWINHPATLFDPTFNNHLGIGELRTALSYCWSTIFVTTLHPDHVGTRLPPVGRMPHQCCGLTTQSEYVHHHLEFSSRGLSSFFYWNPSWNPPSPDSDDVWTFWNGVVNRKSCLLHDRRTDWSKEELPPK